MITDEVQRKFQEIFVLVGESLNEEQVVSFLMKAEELADLSKSWEEGANWAETKAKIVEIIRLVQNNQPEQRRH